MGVVNWGVMSIYDAAEYNIYLPLYYGTGSNPVQIHQSNSRIATHFLNKKPACTPFFLTPILFFGRSVPSGRF